MYEMFVYNHLNTYCAIIKHKDGVMSNFISEEQCVFIVGRSILDNAQIV